MVNSEAAVRLIHAVGCMYNSASSRHTAVYRQQALRIQTQFVI